MIDYAAILSRYCDTISSEIIWINYARIRVATLGYMKGIVHDVIFRGLMKNGEKYYTVF